MVGNSDEISSKIWQNLLLPRLCLTSPPEPLYKKHARQNFWDEKNLGKYVWKPQASQYLCMPLSALRIIQEKWFLTTCSCESLRFFGHIFTTHKWFYFYLRCWLGGRGRIRCRIRGRIRSRIRGYNFAATCGVSHISSRWLYRQYLYLRFIQESVFYVRYIHMWLGILSVAGIVAEVSAEL